MKTKLIVSAVILILVFIFLHRTYGRGPDGSLVMTGFFVSEKTMEYPVSVRVTEQAGNIGLALEEHELDYGIVPQGSLVTKYISINNRGGPAKIRMAVIGNISGFVSFDRNNFILEGSQNISIILDAQEPGNFSGVLKVSAAKPRHGWLNWMLPLL